MNNAEVVARRVLPIIIVLSVVLNPVAKTFTLISSVSASADVVSGLSLCLAFRFVYSINQVKYHHTVPFCRAHASPVVLFLPKDV